MTTSIAASRSATASASPRSAARRKRVTTSAQSGHAVGRWVEEAYRDAETRERVGLVRGEDGVDVDAAVDEHTRIEAHGDLPNLRAIDAAD